MSNKPQVELLLHNIRSVYNVAAIFRVAECLGVSVIYLSGYSPCPIDRFGRSRSDFHKVALGAEHSIKWQQIKEPLSLIADKIANGYQVVALEQDSGSVSLRDYSPDVDVLLIPGTETTGVDQGILSSVDQVIEINQVGQKESLNVLSATSIALWQLLK